MWSERNVLNSLLWEAAVDALGIYPRATLRDGVETPRTEWQDGWNAAVMAIAEKHGVLTTWARGLSPQQSTILREMLDADAEPILLRVSDGSVELALTCSDTFMYACSDAEPFELDDIAEIHRLWSAHGYFGPMAWVARKRAAEPVKEYRYNARYIAAKADLSELAPPKAVAAVDPDAGISTDCPRA